MQRRQFMQAGLATAGTFALGQDFWKHAYAAPSQPGPNPFGELVGPDENGLYLPPGFTARRIAKAYDRVPLANGGESSYVWHRAPDGGAVFPQPDGGWIYASNSEIPIVADECQDGLDNPFCGEQGGVGAVRFNAQGEVIDAYSVLQGTNNNCAGGATPWGTWLSCEENFLGFVYECDPTGSNPPLRLPAMGQFSHEAAAVDPVGKAIYLTEDTGDGAFFRFIPAVWPEGGRPDLTVGELQVAVVGDNPEVRVPYSDTIREILEQVPIIDPHDFPWDQVTGSVEETQPGTVRWMTVPNPLGLPLECRYQIPTAAVFKGGEGCWYDSGIVYFTTKGTNRVWAYDTRAERVDIIYDAAELGESAPLTGVDNITVHPFSHDLFVAEDGGNMELVMITRDRTVAPFLRYPVPHSELAGPAFDPSGTRLYIASQAKRHREDENGNEVRGEIFEITGPFNQRALDGDDSASSRLASTAAGGSTALLTLGGLTLAGLASRIAASPDDEADAG
nr:DUF839 domain-containing protein [Oceanococcus sp. HetDA_MAG_MS8]